LRYVVLAASSLSLFVSELIALLSDVTPFRAGVTLVAEDLQYESRNLFSEDFVTRMQNQISF